MDLFLFPSVSIFDEVNYTIKRVKYKINGFIFISER